MHLTLQNNSRCQDMESVSSCLTPYW